MGGAIAASHLHRGEEVREGHDSQHDPERVAGRHLRQRGVLIRLSGLRERAGRGGWGEGAVSVGIDEGARASG